MCIYFERQWNASCYDSEALTGIKVCFRKAALRSTISSNFLSHQGHHRPTVTEAEARLSSSCSDYLSPHRLCWYVTTLSFSNTMDFQHPEGRCFFILKLSISVCVFVLCGNHNAVERPSITFPCCLTTAESCVYLRLQGKNFYTCAAFKSCREIFTETYWYRSFLLYDSKIMFPVWFWDVWSCEHVSAQR